MVNLHSVTDDDAPNLEELLQMATTSLRQGNTQGAYVMVQQVLDADKHNDRAWVLMAYTTQNPVDRRRYLRTALRLNPENKAARRGLEKMKRSRTKTESRVLYYGTVGLVVLLAVAVIACVLVLLLN